MDTYIQYKMWVAQKVFDEGLPPIILMSWGTGGLSSSSRAFGPQLPARTIGQAAKGSKELLNFTKTTLEHMNNPGRRVPVSILKDAIRSTKGLPDPQGTNALMHYIRMIRNGRLYNLEVLYDEGTNTILHFQYGRDAMGPLKAIPK